MLLMLGREYLIKPQLTSKAMTRIGYGPRHFECARGRWWEGAYRSGSLDCLSRSLTIAKSCLLCLKSILPVSSSLMSLFPRSVADGDWKYSGVLGAAYLPVVSVRVQQVQHQIDIVSRRVEGVSLRRLN